MMKGTPPRTHLFELEPKHAPLVENLQEAPATQKRRDAFESHRHRVFALAYYMTGAELDAEDLLTNTFTRVFLKTDEPDGQQVDASLVTELKQYVEFEPLPAAPPPVVTASGLLQQANIKRPDMEAALTQLPATERMVFLLRDVESQPVERVALTMEMTPQQVNVALFRARLQLREVLAKMQRGES